MLGILLGKILLTQFTDISRLTIPKIDKTQENFFGILGNKNSKISLHLNWLLLYKSFEIGKTLFLKNISKKNLF